MQLKRFSMCIAIFAAMASCSTQKTTEVETPSTGQKVRLINLAPGHFHAALVQKSMFDNVDSVVRVYAEEGPELQDYLQKIDQ
jgi:hypothetical protein